VKPFVQSSNFSLFLSPPKRGKVGKLKFELRNSFAITVRSLKKQAIDSKPAEKIDEKAVQTAKIMTKNA
jgi:hypothetical protein